LWELAKMEGDANWIEWLQTHIWTVSPPFFWLHHSNNVSIGSHN
jgi:hypothetical protein